MYTPLFDVHIHTHTHTLISCSSYFYRAACKRNTRTDDECLLQLKDPSDFTPVTPAATKRLRPTVLLSRCCCGCCRRCCFLPLEKRHTRTHTQADALPFTLNMHKKKKKQTLEPFEDVSEHVLMLPLSSFFNSTMGPDLSLRSTTLTLCAAALFVVGAQLV